MFAVSSRALVTAALLVASATAGAASGLREIDIGRAAENLRLLVAAPSPGTARVIAFDEGPSTDSPAFADAPILEYADVTRVGHRLAALSGSDLQWRFSVVESPAVNAYAVPGGSVVLTRGLFDVLQNEEQLAAVLAYAIAIGAQGIDTRLAEQQARTSAMTAMSAMAAAMLSARRGAGLETQMLGESARFFERKLERSAVHEADIAGSKLLARAGYKPDAMLEVLEKLQALRPVASPKPSPYATHPEPAERTEQLRQALAADAR